MQVETPREEQQIEQKVEQTLQEEGSLFEDINLEQIRIPEYSVETQVEEKEEQAFTVENYNLLGKTVIGVIDGLVILGFWTYARTTIDASITYSEVEGIVGLKATEKTELGRLLGRILLKRGLFVSEEIQFVVAIIRIYVLQKYPAFLHYINSKKPSEEKTTRTKETKKRETRKKKEEKKKMTVKDVLAESEK